MRRAMNPEWVTNEDGSFAGINLSADYCAEHEWGIKKLKSRFGIFEPESQAPFSKWWRELFNKLPSTLGIDKRKTSKVPASLSYQEKDGYHYLGLTHETGWNTGVYEFGDRYDRTNDHEIVTHWDEGAFMIVAKDGDKVLAIKEALENNDAAIWLGGGGPFENSGLIIAIVSNLPTDFIDDMKQSDIDSWQLKKDAVDTGIYKKLDKAGCEFYALSPRRQEDGSVIFWLNPQDQQNHQYGWYGVEELEQWAKGTGPIMNMQNV